MQVAGVRLSHGTGQKGRVTGDKGEQGDSYREGIRDGGQVVGDIWQGENIRDSRWKEGRHRNGGQKVWGNVVWRSGKWGQVARGTGADTGTGRG